MGLFHPFYMITITTDAFSPSPLGFCGAPIVIVAVLIHFSSKSMVFPPLNVLICHYLYDICDWFQGLVLL